MQRRTVLAGIAAVLGGCTSLGLSSRETPGSDAPPVQGGSADYPHELRVENPLDRAVTLDVTVERDDSTLYEGSHEVMAGAETTVAGFTRASFPAERRYVTVRVTTPGNETASVGVSVTDCLGDVVVTFADDGTPQMTYSVC